MEGNQFKLSVPVRPAFKLKHPAGRWLVAKEAEWCKLENMIKNKLGSLEICCLRSRSLKNERCWKWLDNSAADGWFPSGNLDGVKHFGSSEGRNALRNASNSWSTAGQTLRLINPNSSSLCGWCQSQALKQKRLICWRWVGFFPPFCKNSNSSWKICQPAGWPLFLQSPQELQ